MGKGSFVPKNRDTISDFMAQRLTTKTTLRTQQGYRACIKRYINPTIGPVELQRLNPQQIQGIYAGMLARGLSNTTVAQLHRILKQALSHAVTWGALTYNVANAASLPKIQREEMEMWDVETIKEFLDVTDGSRFGHLYQFAVLTGLRRSEICGLKWSNVDLANGRLSVMNTLQRISGHGLVEGEPKTKKSRRFIALAPDAICLLHSVRGEQMEQELEFGNLWQRTGYVFTQPHGSPLEPDQVTQDFARTIQKSGLPHLTLHGLRHAFATLSLTAGVDLKATPERLGHSSIAITADVYSHVMPQVDRAAAEAVERILRRRHPAR